MGYICKPFEGHIPEIHPSAFIAENAVIIGRVFIGAEASIWYGCVLRGDIHDIHIGARSNIQDGTVIHVDGPKSWKGDGLASWVGEGVTVGHQALLHACHIESGAFIGMKSMVMDGAYVEKQAMVAAGAVVTPGKRVPAGELWAGIPAKKFRSLPQEKRDDIEKSAQNYVDLAKRFLKN